MMFSYSLTYWFHFAKMLQMSAKLVVTAPNGNQTRDRQVRATLLQECWDVEMEVALSAPDVAIPAQHSTAWHSAAQHDTAWHSMARHAKTGAPVISQLALEKMHQILLDVL